MTQKNVLNVKASQSSWVRKIRWMGEDTVEITKLARRKTMRNHRVTYTFVNISRAMFEAAADVLEAGESIGKHMHAAGWFTVQPR